MIDMTKKVVLITGAKGGLGSSVTEAFLAAGATVVGVSRSIRQEDFGNPQFLAFPAELTDSQAAQSVVDFVVGRAGRIDVLVHLVGGYAGGKSVADTDDSTLDEMLNMNLKSAFLIIRASLAQMRGQKSGHIITVGSRAAVEPAANAGAYSASKAALVALTRVIAKENAALGISANAILPGTMDTSANRKTMPKSDFSKWVKPSQVAQLILSLASDELSQVSGAAIPIYGSEL